MVLKTVREVDAQLQSLSAEVSTIRDRVAVLTGRSETRGRPLVTVLITAFATLVIVVVPTWLIQSWQRRDDGMSDTVLLVRRNINLAVSALYAEAVAIDGGLATPKQLAEMRATSARAVMTAFAARMEVRHQAERFAPGVADSYQELIFDLDSISEILGSRDKRHLNGSMTELDPKDNDDLALSFALKHARAQIGRSQRPESGREKPMYAQVRDRLIDPTDGAETCVDIVKNWLGAIFDRAVRLRDAD